MKKVIFLAAISVILITLLLGGCSQPAPAPAPSPSPSAAPTTSAAPSPTATASPTAKPSPTASAKPIKLTVSTAGSPDAWNITHSLLPWLKNITDATGGRVTFEVYYGTLAATADQWQAVQSGVADSSLLTHVTYAGVTPLADVMSLPFIQYKSHKQASGIMWQIIDKFPTVAAEFKSTHLVTAWIGVQNLVFDTKKHFKTLDDWKGVKIRTGGGLMPQQFLALGCTPVAMPVTEVYLNLQKGVMEACTGQWDFIYSYRTYELAKYYTYASFSTSLFSFPVNNDDWNGFPQDIKDVFNKFGGQPGAEYWGANMFDSINTAGPDLVKKAGFDMINYNVPSDELDKWIAVAGKPIWDKWVKDTAAKGHPEAQQILDTVISLTKSYNPT
jgi:TRAP-type transport system periplasmic protein